MEYVVALAFWISLAIFLGLLRLCRGLRDGEE